MLYGMDSGFKILFHQRVFRAHQKIQHHLEFLVKWLMLTHIYMFVLTPTNGGEFQ